MWYACLMPKSEVQATVRRSAAITNAGNRMEMAEVKKLIHDSGVCLLAIKMAQAGVRPVADPETGEITEQPLSEAAHVDMVKFMVAKVIPNAKEMETTDDIEAHAYWASVIEADRAKQLASA